MNKKLLYLFLPLFILTAGTSPSAGTELFSEDFESGLGAWTTGAETGCTTAVTGDQARVSANSCATIDNSDVNESAYIQRNFPSSDPLYIRFYMYFKDDFFEQTESRLGVRTMWSFFTAGGGALNLSFQHNRGAGAWLKIGSDESYWGMELSTNTWHCFEVKLPSCTAGASIPWWINGHPQTVLYNVDLSAGQYWSHFQLGLLWTNYADIHQTLYIDDVVISNAYTGPALTGDEPPDVTITDPPNGSRVSGNSSITAEASDPNGLDIDRIVFYLDDVAVSTATDAPYGFTWDSTQYTEGDIRVEAEAFNSEGRNARASVILTVDNVTDPAANPAEEYLWLHVDGKYIRTSPYADPPNEIWMGAGPASVDAWMWRFYIDPHDPRNPVTADGYPNPDGTRGGQFDFVARSAWLKSIGANYTGNSTMCLPYPLGTSCTLGGIRPMGECPTCDEILLSSGTTASNGRPYGWGLTITEVIEKWMGPSVAELKKNEIYTTLIMHGFVGSHSSGDNSRTWMTDGHYWNDADWQLLADYWTEIATYFKDEPWVVGYDLGNEPHYSIGGGYEGDMREGFLKVIRAVREVDTRHIVMPETMMAQTYLLEESWGMMNMRPDEPYNQCAIVIHAYPSIYATLGGISPEDIVTDFENSMVYGKARFIEHCSYVKDKYNIALINTEFGSATPNVENHWLFAGKMTQEQFEAFHRRYETDICNACNDLKIPWTMWLDSSIEPGESYYNKHQYQDAWGPLLAVHCSPVPVLGSAPPVSSRIICTLSPRKYLLAGDSGFITVQAVISDGTGARITTARDNVTFTISGDGTWSDGTTAEKLAPASDGIAQVNVKPSADVGRIKVTASAAGLVSGSITIPVLGDPVRVKLDISPASIAADGESTALLTACLKDSAGNTCVNITEGTVYFSASGFGTLVLEEDVPLSYRALLVDPGGTTYLKFQSGMVPGKAAITASFGSLAPGSAVVYVGQAAPVFPNLKVFPNAPRATASTPVRFESAGEDSTVKIYTISGKLVKTLSGEDFGSGDITWDLLNSRGSSIQRGLYIYSIENDNGDKKTGKIIMR